MKRYPDMINIFYLLPIFFFISIFAALPLALVSYLIWHLPNPVVLFFALPLLYFPLIILFSLYISSANKRLDLFPKVTYAFILTHLGYSLGEIQGLFRSKKDGGLSDKAPTV